ncbi:MAG: hypothetical protein WD904_10055 [Dehalococcoidia bacterium]
MRRLFFVVMMLLAYAAACGGDPNATSTPTASQTQDAEAASPTPYVTSAEQAILIAKHNIEKHFASEDTVETTATHMRAIEAAEQLEAEGLTVIDIMPDGYSCPGGCPPPGVPKEQPGYLVMTRGSNGEPITAHNPEKVLVSWISDAGDDHGFNLQLRYVDAAGRAYSRMAN